MRKYFIFTKTIAYILFIIIGVLVMYVYNCTSYKTVKAVTPSKAEAVIEVQTGRVLYKNNANIPLPMASTTKVLTAIIIIEDIDLKQVITVGKESVGIEGSSIYLKENDKVTIEDLLYGLMLRSGNDCAETLALHHSGSIEKFAQIMTERAKSMGAINSNFKNPHGLPVKNHYTTAEDLAKISAYAMRNAIFRKIVSTKQYLTSIQEGTDRRLFINKNKLLYNYSFADGVKTGFTKEAGRCLVSSATKNGMQIVAVVINSPNMYERSEELLESVFAKYSMQKVFDATILPKELPTDVKNKYCAIGGANDVYYPIENNEEKRIIKKISLPQNVKLPIAKGDVVGNFELYLEEKCIVQENIYALQDVKKSYFDILKDICH